MAVKDEQERRKVPLGFQDVHAQIFRPPAADGMSCFTFVDHLADRLSCDCCRVKHTLKPADPAAVRVRQERQEMSGLAIKNQGASQINRYGVIAGIFEGVGRGINQATGIHAEITSFINDRGM